MNSNLTEMMKSGKFFSGILLFFLLDGYAQARNFSELALNDILLTEENEKVPFRTILDENQGRTIFLDIWASWCKDCVVGMPKVRKLKEEYPRVSFVYISLDRNEADWKKGIQRFGIGDGQHYWATKGWKSDLFNDLDLDWIPRYMILDGSGNIALYRAIKADDKKIINYLKNEQDEK
ncbi:TlpA disulfide reductase family protein [Ulvibacterium sp.]|uniref:TlpA family protein disulfide reductase n=1 Tax=Ulvibacterium sp. TaxID=2665914 RepID=UPI00262DD552|nr:TlpA disulfide reductase family protein [Ulvibacterium sp.]